MSDIRTFCLQCECETVHSVLDEPVVLTVGMLDCRGQRGQVRVGTEMLRCGVCQRTQPNPGYLMPMLPRAHRRMLRDGFAEATAGLSVEWAIHVVETRRRAARVWAAAGIAIGLVAWGVSPTVAAIGSVVGLLALAQWSLWDTRSIERSEPLMRRVTRRWMKRSNRERIRSGKRERNRACGE